MGILSFSLIGDIAKMIQHLGLKEARGWGKAHDEVEVYNLNSDSKKTAHPLILANLPSKYI